MDREDEARRFWLGLVLALLLARAARAFLSTLFFESLNTFRLNESAWWMLVLLAPALAPLLPRRGLPPLVLVASVATTGLPFARFTDAYVPLAGLACAGALAAILRAGALPGALAGLGVDAASLALGSSLEPSSALVPLALALAALLLARRAPAPERPAGLGWAAGAAAASLLAVELAFLAGPHAAGRWLGVPAWVAAAASGLGLAVGATRLRHAGRWIWIAGALALVDVALVRSVLASLSLALVQAAAGAAAARLAPHLPTPTGAIAFSAVFAPLAFTLLYFRAPLGIAEWEALVPLLLALACAAAVFEPRPPKARARSGAAAAAIVLAASAVAAATATHAIAPPSDDGTITVATWNVHQAFGNRGALDPQLYADVLRDLDADIILLQETDTARLSSGHVDITQWLGRELGMHAAYGRGGPSVLSRYPFADVPRPESDDWTLEVALDVEGTIVWAHSVHLSIGRLGNRTAQIASLLAEPERGPHIVGGDLNLCAVGCGTIVIVPNGQQPGVDPRYAQLTSRYTDAWTDAGRALDDPTGATFRLPDPSRRFDHILTEGFDTLDVHVVHDARTRAASDHLPVVATFRLLEAP